MKIEMLSHTADRKPRLKITDQGSLLGLHPWIRQTRPQSLHSPDSCSPPLGCWEQPGCPHLALESGQSRAGADLQACFFFPNSPVRYLPPLLLGRHEGWRESWSVIDVFPDGDMGPRKWRINSNSNVYPASGVIFSMLERLLTLGCILFSFGKVRYVISKLFLLSKQRKQLPQHLLPLVCSAASRRSKIKFVHYLNTAMILFSSPYVVTNSQFSLGCCPLRILYL